jgi:galactose mutarotase-like enzyme
MKNHGFARFKEFEVARRAPDGVDFKLVSDNDTRAQYPFDFELGIGYALSGATLVHRFTVKNTGRTVMPFSFGGHPGFRCPAFDDERYEDYSLVFEKPETVLCRRKENGLKADARYPFLEGGVCMALEKERFALSAILLDHLNSSSVRLVSAVHGPLVEVRFAGFTHLGLWSGAGDDPFVCIEPWYGIDSAADDRSLEEKEGILFLEPGATKEAAFEIECL